MNCAEIPELAPLYVAGELAARTAAFADHLRRCPACRQELAEQSAFDERLRSAILSEPVDTSAVEQRIRDIIHAPQDTPHRWKFAAAAIAAVLVLAAVGYFELRSSRSSPVAIAAAADHRMEIIDHQPRPWLTDGTAIEALAAKQGLPASAVSALTSAGYRLVQGKLCYLDGHWFLHLVYANPLGSASVYLRRVDAFASSDIHVGTMATEHVAEFQHGRFSTLVVTTQPREAARRLAQSLALVI
jgi:anti-sigma factor RsiW